MFRHSIRAVLALFMVLLPIASLVGQNTASPVNDIEALIRAHDYDRARTTAETALRSSPRNSHLWCFTHCWPPAAGPCCGSEIGTAGES